MRFAFVSYGASGLAAGAVLGLPWAVIVRDVTPAVAMLPVQLLAYGVAAAAVFRLSGR